MYDPVSAITAIVPTALSAVGTIVGMDSSRKAAHQQEDAAAAAAAGFDPYKKAGVNALWNLEDRINAGPGEFTKSPGYDFRLQQGVNALDRSAAARGKLLSGSQAKAITQYGQDYGSSEYQNWLNQWYQSLTPYQNLVNTGLSAQGASVLPTMTVGESRAAGTLGQANSLNNLLNWGTNQVPAVTNMFANPGYSAPLNYFNTGLASGGNAWGGSPWASATMGIF
jgi:hypothetical protein